MSSRIIRIVQNPPDSPPGTPAPSEDAPRIERFHFRTAGEAGQQQSAARSEEHHHRAANSQVGSGLAPVDPSSVEEQCERLLQEARLKVAEIEKEAYEKGFAEGQKAGIEVGERMGEALLKQYSANLVALNKLRKDLFVASERDVVRLSLEIAKKIIKREVAIDEELILTLVKVALARVADQAMVTVRVNPKDYHSIERHHAAGIVGSDVGTLAESVKLVEDPLIARGGCIIETESGTIDARVEEQLREIERGFFE